MSRCFSVPVYLTGQVSDDCCYNLALLCTAQLFLVLIVLPTRSLVLIRSDSVCTAHMQNYPLRTCELYSEFPWTVFKRSVWLCRWSGLWGWDRMGLGSSKEGLDTKEADCWFQDKWRHWKILWSCHGNKSLVLLWALNCNRPNKSLIKVLWKYIQHARVKIHPCCCEDRHSLVF